MYTYGANYKDPSLSYDIQVDIWRGYIKAAMQDAYAKSNDDCVTINQVAGKREIKVVATKAFKVGKMVLACVSRNVSIVKQGDTKTKTAEGTVSIGQLFTTQVDGEDVPVFGYVKNDLVFPTTEVRSGFARPDRDTFITAYSACSMLATLDHIKANAERSSIEVPIKVGKMTTSINVPIIRNTKDIAVGGTIILLKVSADRAADGDDDDDDDGEPARKRAKAAASGGKGGGKKGGKGKKGKK